MPESMGDTLEGKIALITGASSGLGEHMAMTLAGAGAHVIIAARREERLARLQQRIEGAGGSAMAVAMDVRDPDSIRAGFDHAAATLGTVDILINNAGLAVQKDATDCTDADYDLVMDTNLKGAWITAQAAARQMIERGQGGKIVNISSLLALKPIRQLALYAMSKAAIAQMTRALALEWIRHGIQVNALCPGYIETEMNSAHWKSEGGRALIARMPARRILQPEVLDGIVLLLASKQSDNITGAVIPIDDAQSLM